MKIKFPAQISPKFKKIFAKISLYKCPKIQLFLKKFAKKKKKTLFINQKSLKFRRISF